MTPKDLRQSLPLFEDFVDRFTPLLVDDQRSESRKERADAYLRGLLLDAESTKTAEAIALKVYGDASQVRMTQVFLGQSDWPDAPVRQELAVWVDQELGSPQGTLIVDESGFPKLTAIPPTSGHIARNSSKRICAARSSRSATTNVA